MAKKQMTKQQYKELAEKLQAENQQLKAELELIKEARDVLVQSLLSMNGLATDK